MLPCSICPTVQRLPRPPRFGPSLVNEPWIRVSMTGA